DFVRDDKTNRIYLEHGKPARFGEDDAKGVRQRDDGSVGIVDVKDESELLVHDVHAVEPSQAFALSRLTRETSGAAPSGVFLVVVAHDDLTGEDVRIPVEPHRAAEVFRHPFAYASEGQVVRSKLARV